MTVHFPWLKWWFCLYFDLIFLTGFCFFWYWDLGICHRSFFSHFAQHVFDQVCGRTELNSNKLLFLCIESVLGPFLFFRLYYARFYWKYTCFREGLTPLCKGIPFWVVFIEKLIYNRRISWIIITCWQKLFGCSCTLPNTCQSVLWNDFSVRNGFLTFNLVVPSLFLYYNCNIRCPNNSTTRMKLKTIVHAETKTFGTSTKLKMSQHVKTKNKFSSSLNACLVLLLLIQL